MPTIYDDAFYGGKFDHDRFRQEVAKLLSDDQIIHSPDTPYLIDFVEFDAGQYYRHAAKIVLHLIERDESGDTMFELPEYPGQKIPVRYILANHFLILLTKHLADSSEMQKSINLSFLRYIRLLRPFTKYPARSQDLYVGDVDE